MYAFHGNGGLDGLLRQEDYLQRLREEGPHDGGLFPVYRSGMGTQHPEGIPVFPSDEPFEIL
jgi:hypothetical protein